MNKLRRLKMKLVLNSNYEEARKVMACFPSARLVKPILDGATFVECVGDAFIIKYMGPLGGWLYQDRSEITIDLSKSTPCIYACMKHGLKVEVVLVNHPAYELEPRYFNLSRGGHRSFLMAELSARSIKSIKILNLDQMEGCEVVG
jgi:hypothetical protein